MSQARFRKLLPVMDFVGMNGLTPSSHCFPSRLLDHPANVDPMLGKVHRKRITPVPG
jgi:hypothetical protein